MTKKILIGVLFSALLLLSGTGFSYAQKTTDNKAPKIVIDPILGTTTNIEKTPTYQKKKYHEGNYKNLAKLYWAVGMHNIHNNAAIDGFLRVTECDLYKKYAHDDFKWEEIREATKKLLAKDRHSFPTTFEILLPLSLGNYDMRREAFTILDETSFKNMKKIDIALSSGTADKCGSAVYIKEYPESVIMILDQPFNFAEVPVKPEVADLFIHEATVVDQASLNYKRDAYLRVLVSFSSYVNIANMAGGTFAAVMHAKIDAIEVYADSRRTKPLYIKDFAEIRRRHKVTSVDNSLKEEVDKALSWLITVDPDDDKMIQIR